MIFWEKLLRSGERVVVHERSDTVRLLARNTEDEQVVLHLRFTEAGRLGEELIAAARGTE